MLRQRSDYLRLIVFAVWCNFKRGYTCRIILDVLKDGSLQINN